MQAPCRQPIKESGNDFFFLKMETNRDVGFLIARLGRVSVCRMVASLIFLPLLSSSLYPRPCRISARVATRSLHAPMPALCSLTPPAAHHFTSSPSPLLLSLLFSSTSATPFPNSSASGVRGSMWPRWTLLVSLGNEPQRWQ